MKLTGQERSRRDELPARGERPDACSVERALAVLGDRWTFLILRDAYFGVRRFDDFRRNLGTAPNILSDRLKKLVSGELLERRRYSERPPRFEYALTERGIDLYPAIVLLMRWGDRWFDGGLGPPLELVHEPCGHPTAPVLACDRCGDAIAARNVTWRPGPGAFPKQRRKRRATRRR